MTILPRQKSQNKQTNIFALILLCLGILALSDWLADKASKMCSDTIVLGKKSSTKYSSYFLNSQKVGYQNNNISWWVERNALTEIKRIWWKSENLCLTIWIDKERK